MALLLSVAVGRSHGQTTAPDSLAAGKTGTFVAVGRPFEKAVTALDARYSGIGGQVDRQTTAYLGKLEKRELALRQKMQGLDSNKAKAVLGSTEKFYAGLRQKMQSTEKKVQSLKQYMPGLDSIQAATKFLGQLNGVNLNTDQLAKVTALNASTAALQSKLQAVTGIRQLLQARQDELRAQLAKFDVGKQLAGINKQVYYYQQQLGEYKELLHDTKKLEDKAMSIVRGIPAFKNFFAKQSQLARMFGAGMSTGANTTGSLSALQTRPQLMQAIGQRLGTTGTQGLEQQLNSQLQSGASQMGQLRDKLANGPAVPDLPNFKPNNQHTKSFLKRVIYGFNVQSGPSNKYLPAYMDVAITIGYKMSDKIQIGVAGSYKLGVGTAWNNINLTHQGIGLRSWVDIKTGKGNWWLSGGGESNYLSAFKNIAALKNGTPWQKSALLGVSKTYKAGKKANGKMQLLYDFLYDKHVPSTIPLVFRFGYTFN